MKKKISSEYGEYERFLKKYFSYSPLIPFLKSDNMHKLFDASMSITKIVYCLQELPSLESLMKILEYNGNNFLYLLPLNEMISLNVSIRNTSETLIKLAYTLNDNNNQHASSGYRTLNENRSSLRIYNENKNKVDNLFSIYSNRSNHIHLKKVHTKELTSVLESKLLSPLSLSEIDQMRVDLNNCKLFLLELIIFYKIPLSTQQKLYLKLYLSESWIKKINLL